jgi:hypothetical protein
MERAVYAAIKRTDQEQIAVEKRQLVERVPLLAVLAPVGHMGRRGVGAVAVVGGDNSCAGRGTAPAGRARVE